MTGEKRRAEVFDRPTDAGLKTPSVERLAGALHQRGHDLICAIVVEDRACVVAQVIERLAKRIMQVSLFKWGEISVLEHRPHLLNQRSIGSIDPLSRHQAQISRSAFGLQFDRARKAGVCFIKFAAPLQ